MIATIAIIDDDDAVRDSTRALLECSGYEVHEHASAEDFLSQRRAEVDFLLVDHHMTGLTGLDLLEQLREGGDEIPALIVTGRSDATLVARAARVGVKLLEKPAVAEHLIIAIETARRTRPKTGCR